MTIQISRYRRSMALIAGAAMALTLSPAVLAQDTGANPASDQRIERRERSDRRSSRASKEAQQRYPLATRESPGLKTSGRTGKKLQEMVDLQAEGKSAEAGAIAASLLASEDTSNYERRWPPRRQPKWPTTPAIPPGRWRCSSGSSRSMRSTTTTTTR